MVHPFAGPETPVVGCQREVLVPWPNRVVDGCWTWRGVSYQLSITEPERGHALHGLVRGATWVETDERLAPVRRRPTVGSPYDLSDDASIGGRQIDPLTDLAVRTDGRAEVRLIAPDGRTTVACGDDAVRWWQVYTGDTLPARWRRATVAVEPMTCAPDAFNSGDGAVVLEPGDRHSMSWGVRLVCRGAGRRWNARRASISG